PTAAPTHRAPDRQGCGVAGLGQHGTGRSRGAPTPLPPGGARRGPSAAPARAPETAEQAPGHGRPPGGDPAAGEDAAAACLPPADRSEAAAPGRCRLPGRPAGRHTVAQEPPGQEQQRCRLGAGPSHACVQGRGRREAPTAEAPTPPLLLQLCRDQLPPTRALPPPPATDRQRACSTSNPRLTYAAVPSTRTHARPLSTTPGRPSNRCCATVAAHRRGTKGSAPLPAFSTPA